MSDLKMIKDDPSFLNGKYDESLDAFNHGAFANTIYKILLENDPPLTIGLFGGWGVGKTSIINIIQNKIKSTDKIDTVYFNAWQYSEDSFRRQFLLTVVKDLVKDDVVRDSELKRIQRLNYAKTLEEFPGESIKDLFTKARSNGVFWKTLKREVGNAFENVRFADLGLVRIFFSGMFVLIGLMLFVAGIFKNDPEIQRWSLTVFILSAASFFAPKIESTFILKRKEVFDAKLIFPEQFIEEYSMLLAKYASNIDKVLIIVDDLDRCDIDTIKNVLITLKNFLGDKKSVFIVPLDDSSVVQLFKGENHNFGYEQLRKYFNISIRIPELHFEDIIDFAEKIAQQYSVPIDVTLIASLGYCNDARKMKHFLNLYKVKEAIATERIAESFLGNLKIEEIQKQLAKTAILEYQYPELYRYLTKNPQKLDGLTEFALTDEIDDSLSDFIEINPNYKNVTDVWKFNLGLKEFLKRTNDIKFTDFEIIAKLKVPNQEKELANAGIELKELLLSTDQKKIEEISADIIKEKSSQLYHLLTKHLGGQSSILRERAYNISLLILEKYDLNIYYKGNLISSIIRTASNKLNNLKLDIPSAQIFLNNYNSISKENKLKLSRIIEDHIFKSDKTIKTFSGIINDNNFSDLTKLNYSLTNTIVQKLNNDFGKLEDKNEVKNYLDEIIKINYSSEDKKDMRLLIPSLEIMNISISHINEINQYYHEGLLNSIKGLLFSNQNVFDLELINGFLCEKIETVVKNNITDYSYNKTLQYICNLMIQSPKFLEEKNAISIGSQITEHFTGFSTQESMIDLLGVLILVILSINDDESSKEEYTNSHTKFIDGSNYEVFTSHLIQVDEMIESPNQEKEEINQNIIRRKWEFIDQNYSNNDIELVKFAKYCSDYNDIVPSSAQVTLLNQLILSNNLQVLEIWNEYILETGSKISIPERKTVIDSGFTFLTNPSNTFNLRNNIFILLMKFIKLSDSSSFDLEKVKLLKLLSSDNDTDLRRILISNADLFIEVFGDQTVVTKVTEILNEILEETDLNSYSDSINFLLKYKEHLLSFIWEKVASKIESEMFNSNLTNEHKIVLLDLSLHIPGLGDFQRHKLSETLFYAKDSQSDDSIKAKAWEVYVQLTQANIINHFTPPSSE